MVGMSFHDGKSVGKDKGCKTQYLSFSFCAFLSAYAYPVSSQVRLTRSYL